jgi:hypothetical protein
MDKPKQDEAIIGRDARETEIVYRPEAQVGVEFDEDGEEFGDFEIEFEIESPETGGEA